MLYWTIIKVAIKSLIANRMRSVLTMLGIIIGVAAVISMLAMGSGAQKQILERVQAMGSNLIIVRPGSSGSRGVASSSRRTLKLEDAEALIDTVKDLEMVSPVAQGNGQFKYYNSNKRSNILGVAPTYFKIRNYEVEKGRKFSEVEVEAMSRVAVIGSVVKDELFQDEDPLEKTIKINGTNFKVIGVIKSKGDQGFFNPDDQALIPFSTAMKQLLGMDYLSEIDIQIKPNLDSTAVQVKIEELIRKRHRIQDPENDDFSVRNMIEMAETMTAMSRTFTILLGSVAAISLLVGGIGIMNIMLVTVTERTREIGVRKAIGAKDRDVLFQFLVESLIMSFSGGILGATLGIGGALTISKFTQFKTFVEPSSVVLALSVSIAIGIFFGFYPARRAAQLDPIDALQYE